MWPLSVAEPDGWMQRGVLTVKRAQQALLAENRSELLSDVEAVPIRCDNQGAIA